MQAARAGANAKLILVIDDDPLVLEAMGGLFRLWGYEVLTAATERAARARLAERRRAPDLIVCDYHLSGGATGIEAIGRLRGALPIPAFLITSDVAVAESAEATASGIHVVHKPADAKILRATLRRLLGGSAREQ
jgi:two-component system, sensor histidine kinase